MNKTQNKGRAEAVKTFSGPLPEKTYDNLTYLASFICGVPVALISIIKDNKQSFKSVYGTGFKITSTENPFCYYAIKQDEGVTIIENTLKNPITKDNPFVVSNPNIGFYAGVPLKSPEGIAIGTLCVLDFKPNSLNDEQAEALQALARQVEQILNLQKAEIDANRKNNSIVNYTNKLDNIIKATRVGTWEWDIETDEIKINDRYAEMLGYTKKELGPITSQTWYKMVHPEDAETSDKLVAKCFNKELEFYEVECRMTHKNGHIVWVNDSGKVVEWTNDGKPLVMMGTHTDITKKKNTELRLQNITDNIPGVVFRYFKNPKGKDKLVQLSKGAKELWGYSPEEIMEDNMLVWNRTHPEDTQSLLKSIEDAYNNFSYWTLEWRYLHPNGETRWLKGSGNPSRIDENTIVWDCFTHDITDRKKTDNIIKYNEKRFKALVQEGSDLISILDRDGFYTYISPTSERLMGFSSDDLLGKNVKGFVHPDDWQELSDNFKLLKEQKQIFTNPFRYKNSKNEWRWVETTATNLLRDPSIEGIVTNSRDITERIIYEKELQESNERYNMVNKATNDAIYDWDILNDTFYWGDGLKRLFGHNYSNKVFRLQDWSKFTHPQDSLKHQKRWDDFLSDKNQSTWKDEFRFLKADDSYAYVEENGFVIRNAKGEPIRMIGALRDKTASKIKGLQQELEFEVANFFKEHNNKLGQILDDVLNYLVEFTGFETGEIWLTSTNKKDLNLFKAFKQTKTAKAFYRESKQITKFKKGEGLPGTVWKLNSIQVFDNIDTNKKFHRQNAAKTSGLKSALGIPLTHNQNTIGVLIFASKSPAKKIKEEIKLLEPLNQYLGAEIKRKQQEEETQLFFDSSPEIMAVAGPNGYFIKVNQAFCDILGYSKEEITSQPFTHFLHPDDLKQTNKEYTETISGKKLANNFINRYRTKGGDYRWISWSSSEFFGEDGIFYTYGKDITDLIELQRLFENAAKLAKIGSWELDLRDSASNNNVFWSTMTREVMEVDKHYNPTNSAGLEFCLGKHKRNLSKAVQNLIKTGEPFDLELQILSGKGNLKWVRCLGESERINGKCIKVFGSYQDINQRKQAELKVKEALAERNNILESIGDAFFAVDQDWHVTYWNNKAEELILTKKEQVIGKNIWEVFSTHIGLKAYNEYHKAMKYHEAVNFEYYYPENDSWLEVSAYPSKTGLSVYFKDITDRKKQEKIISDSNDRFEKITEATNDAIWDFDAITNTIFWGKGFESQFGYKLDQTPPTLDFFFDFIHPDDRNQVTDKIEKFITDGISTNWFEEYRFKKADGTYAHVMDRAICIRDESGNVTRVVGATTDISYRKEHEEALKKLNDRLIRHAKELEISNQELEQFAYVTSHDLQEPLRMISSFLMLLEKKYSDKLDEKALEYIYYAVDGAKRMKKIILDLLEFSKVGRFNENKQIIDVNEIVDEFCILRKKSISEKNVTIHYESLPKISTYRVPLTQVLHNLLDNAIKYSKKNESPVINIKVEEHPGHWEFSIQDNGIGIAPDFFNKIFIIFQRLHSNDVYEGTGMGLAIVKKIIDTLEGKIWVTSQPGEGSTFYFTIPGTI